MLNPPVDIRRVLIALSGVEGELAYLDEAMNLAEHLQVKLATLFVEDANLLRASMLPGVREIGRSSAQSRQLELADLERRLKLAAVTAESRLRRMAEARALPYSFQVMRGRPVTQLLNLAEAFDVMLLAAPPWERRRLSGNRPVAVLYPGGGEAKRALAMAVALARGTDSLLHVLIVSDDEAGYRQHLLAIKQYTTGLAVSGEWLTSAAMLPDRMNRLGAGLLVLASDEAMNVASLDRLRGRLCCDLLLLR